MQLTELIYDLDQHVRNQENNGVETVGAYMISFITCSSSVSPF